ncbi:MAG TPA: threonine--tRNA ligase [Thermoanaerobaculia bacterium]|nr:threonine--tRNA ligase [Thermoanaerobaculia bacterium]
MCAETVSSQQTITLTLPDGSSREVARGTTALDVAAAIGPRLAKDAVGAELDGEPVDLRTPLLRSGRFRIFTLKSPEAGPFLRHTAEHLLADAVKRLWPEAVIDVGRKDHTEKFQYDFRFPRAFTPEDLAAIAVKMREIAAEDHPLERLETTREEAARLFAEVGEDLKVDRLGDIPEGEVITLYRHGPFVDLCRGPHAQRTGQVGALQLLESSGVFFRGDESRERLQRIYGTAFANEQELEAWRESQERARARDHRRLGPELDLFSFSQHAPGSPFFHPRGAHLYNALMDYVRERIDEKYGEVITPQILDVELWKTSGHWDHYVENMYFTEIDERTYAVKPMNCPGHCLIFGTRPRSYRDLPIRYSDFGRLHRYERSGVISGLTRVRSFAQDDAHVFCTEEQVEEEVIACVETILSIYRTFGFSDLLIEVSTRPEKAIGSAELWARAEAALMGALRGRGIDFTVNEGDGAFYGPKIDFQVKDALGRSWQLGTVQLDYQMPSRFGLAYTGADGAEHTPVMIHRAMLGSLERFIGILIEHLGGAFPLWLAPVQAVLLPVSDRFLEPAQAVAARLRQAGLRVEVDERSEKLGYKIREAQLQKVPFMLVLGGKEVENGTVSVRSRSGGDLGAMEVEAFVDRCRDLVARRALGLEGEGAAGG